MKTMSNRSGVLSTKNRPSVNGLFPRVLIAPIGSKGLRIASPVLAGEDQVPHSRFVIRGALKSHGSFLLLPPLRMRTDSGLSWESMGRWTKSSMEAISGTGVVRVWNPIREKGKLLPSLSDGDVSIDRVFIMDDLHVFPLGLDRRTDESVLFPMNNTIAWRRVRRIAMPQKRASRNVDGNEGF